MTYSGKGLSALKNRENKMISLSDQQLASMIDYIRDSKDILAFYIYGSYGTKYQTPLSDLDLAILPMPEAKLDLERELSIEVKLTEIGNSDHVNMINLANVPLTLQMKVLEQGCLLYCADEILLADFTEKVIKLFCDFAPDLEAIYKDYDAGLREVYL